MRQSELRNTRSSAPGVIDAAKGGGDNVEIEALGAALVLRRIDDARMGVDAELLQILLERRRHAAA